MCVFTRQSTRYVFDFVQIVCECSERQYMILSPNEYRLYRLNTELPAFIFEIFYFRLIVVRFHNIIDITLGKYHTKRDFV